MRLAVGGATSAASASAHIGSGPGLVGERLEQVELRRAQLGHERGAVEAAARGAQGAQEVVEAGGEGFYFAALSSLEETAIS